MAYHLLQHDPQGADMLGQALAGARCARSLRALLQLSGKKRSAAPHASNPKRDRSLLVHRSRRRPTGNAIESSHGYRGLYYVLMGRVAPP